MAKRKTDWDHNKLNRFLKEGRGMGEGREYKPWLEIQDFPSMGRATRIMGWTTQRIHHFFSDTQLKYFYLLDWEAKVIDIREHYPLLDLEETLENITDLRLDKFRDRKTKEPYVFTTTFLITLLNSDGKEALAARSIKYASEIEKKNTIEKLEFERRYWEAKEVDWGIVTNKEINQIRVKNIEWVHSMLNSYDYNDIPVDEIKELAEGLIHRFINNSKSIKIIICGYESDYSLNEGTGIFLFKYLIANRRIALDMDKPINIKEKGSIISISESKEKGELDGDEVYG